MNNNNNKNTNIMQLEAKDIYNNLYTVKKDNKKKYKATLDYSLETLKLQELFPRKKLFYNIDNKQYTDCIISVTFNYSVKNDNDKVIINTKQLREKLYKDGFNITIGDKTHCYVRYKRSGGSARVGKCLFIRQDLYNKMMKWSYMGIKHNNGCKIDLASIEAYIALTTSSIIDTITIEPKNILLIDDYESIFTDKVMCTSIKKIDGADRLVTAPTEVKISNNIWDGQSLLDSSIFNKNNYSDKGFLLLRNRFFKSAAFNTNIQQFFTDNNITDIKQLNGKTIATNIKDIKLITTPSSIKYLKFGTWEYYIKNIEAAFGVVKYDKPTHYFNGFLVSTHYQLINTLQFNKDEMKTFLQQTLDYVKLLKTNLPVFKNHLKLKKIDTIEENTINSTNDLMLKMLSINDDFANTQAFINFKADTVDSYVNNIKQGHVLVNGNYSVLFGNGLEMLKASINKFDGTSTLKNNEIHNKNFNYNIDILGSRSPHVTMGNILLAKNVEAPTIDKYFNLSKQIVCINSINNNILERLSGADFDSDTMLLTDNKILIDKAKVNYNNFLVPTSNVTAKKVIRTNTCQQKADLDIKTSVNLIGDIINFSQILNSILWDKVSNGASINSKEIQKLYGDISQLDVMSCIEIDKAKKEFSIDNKKELELLRKKYKITDIDKKTIRPYFFKYVGEGKNYNFKKINTSMDYLEQVIETEIRKIRCKRIEKKTTFIELFAKTNNIKLKHANKKQIEKIIKEVTELKKQTSLIWNSNSLTKQEKYLKANDLKNNYIKQIKKLTITAATIKKLIIDINNNKELVAISRKLLSILFTAHETEFIKVFEDAAANTTTNIKRANKKDNALTNSKIIYLYDIKHIAV